MICQDTLQNGPFWQTEKSRKIWCFTTNRTYNCRLGTYNCRLATYNCRLEELLHNSRACLNHNKNTILGMHYLPLMCDLCRACSLSCLSCRSRTMLSSRRRNPRTRATRAKTQTTRMQTTRTPSQTPSDPSAETTKTWRPCVR
jgi:hypothetical protein